jgi:hypothetical protein
VSDLSGLPGLLREVAERFGLATALKFGAEFGGNYISVPASAEPHFKIAVVMGTPFLEWLVARSGSEKLMVPLGPHSSYNARVAAIRRMTAEGASAAEIRAALFCHSRTVTRHRRTLRERRPDPRQPRLI